MKNIYSILFCMIIAVNAFAADLTASTTATAFGKKTGKITLAITGGFAPYTILWTGPSGYTSGKLNPDSLAAGDYCVTVTDQYCGVAKLCITVTEKANGIAEFAQGKMSVYPNPFSNQLSIELEQVPFGKVGLQLYDQTGRLVASQEQAAQKHIIWKLDRKLAAGIYILGLSTEDGKRYQQQLVSLGNE